MRYLSFADPSRRDDALVTVNNLIVDYHAQRANEVTRPEPGDQHEALTTLKKACTRLSDFIQSLDSDIVHALKTAAGVAPPTSAEFRLGSDLEAARINKYFRQSIRWLLTEAAIKLLGDWAAEAPKHLREKKKGQHPNLSLRRLVWELAILWLQTTGKPFNYSWNKERARHFLHEVVRVVEPDLFFGNADGTPFQLDAAMRWVRRKLEKDRIVDSRGNYLV